MLWPPHGQESRTLVNQFYIMDFRIRVPFSRVKGNDAEEGYSHCAPTQVDACGGNWEGCCPCTVIPFPLFSCALQTGQECPVYRFISGFPDDAAPRFCGFWWDSPRSNALHLHERTDNHADASAVASRVVSWDCLMWGQDNARRCFQE